MPAKKTAEKQYRVTSIGGISLRSSPDPKSPLYEVWLEWADGQVFTPPEHMKIDLALKRGIVVEVD